jgi:hypothetical protein
MDTINHKQQTDQCHALTDIEHNVENNSGHTDTGQTEGTM